MGVAMIVINVLLVVAALAGAWQVFVKAGREGWEAIVPLYNIYALTLAIIAHPPK